MTRERNFDVARAVAQLNKILQMELATVVYYTHYAFMIYGHARIPIRSWFNDQAGESLAHAREAGDLIVHLGHRPEMGIAPLPETQHNSIDEILNEAVMREEAGVELYRQLLEMIKDKSTVLEEYATRMIAAEAIHVSEMQLMLMRSAPE
ncbi:MAG: ferritin-like domain-containing protein [Alphaproteobacteria bacterium]|nr:ferritin-like domain-containing protein [Alphaproteobacteria bacterium]